MRSRFPAIETPNRDYRDLRSATQSRKRGRDRYHKYSKFRVVDEGQRDNPQYEGYAMPPYRPYNPSWPLEAGDNAQIIARVPKRAFLKAARLVLGCNHGRRCGIKREKETIRRVEFRRGSRYARELAHSYMKTGFALRPAGWNGDLDYRRDFDHFYDVEPYCCEEYCQFQTSWDSECDSEVLESYGCYYFLDEMEYDCDDSMVSDQGMDWAEIASVGSWDDCDVVADDMSEWSEVEGEDIPSL